ncbi:hypothetical protein BDD12DRAFT_472884 [Trichophaea hybrida]|nr:hypothetical protein BDD12DRAFT_472884 [Trichophaea hybrida]
MLTALRSRGTVQTKCGGTIGIRRRGRMRNFETFHERKENIKSLFVKPAHTPNLSTHPKNQPQRQTQPKHKPSI